MQKIFPSVWFTTNAEEAVSFYLEVFREGSIHEVTRYPGVGQEIHGMSEGTVLTIDFEIEGYRFLALNGGPVFSPTPAISFMVNFDPSRESDAEGRLARVWEKLTEGGKVLMPLQEYPFSKKYGWIQDKYGVSWQLFLTDPNGEERPVIIPSLLYVGDVAGKAEEAITFYTSIFKASRLGTLVRYPNGREPDKEGTLMFADFMLEGEWFAAMDSAHAHEFTFTEGVSFIIECKDQAEIDYYWEKLSAVKESEQCGWLKDAFGVSWQVSPENMGAMLNHPDKAKRDRVMDAMLQMKKIDIKALQDAFNG